MDYSPRLLQPECYRYSDNVSPRQTRHAGDTAPVAKCRVLPLFVSFLETHLNKTVHWLRDWKPGVKLLWSPLSLR